MEKSDINHNMQYFDDNQRLIFPPSLEKLIENYDEQDLTLFEAISFKYSSSQNHILSSSSPRKRATPGESSRGRSNNIHPTANAPLPSLPEDDETRFLRGNVSKLEAQCQDLDLTIEALRADISKLQSKLDENRCSQSRQSDPKHVKTPSTKRTRVSTPKDKEGTELKEYYKALYEKEKAQYDGLMNALSQKKQNIHVNLITRNPR